MIVGISAVASSAPANATLATCADGSTAQNSITVEPSHPTVMYIDSGMNPRVDAGYIGYRISNRTGSTIKGYWASFDNFTGGVVSLANPLDKYLDIPEIANNETKTVYVLVKATGSTRSIQAHDFKIFDEFPSASTAQNKYACNFAFAKVAETIKAAANKPESTSVIGGLGTIGSTFQVKSIGATGTIGAGNPDVGRILWFTPAAYSSFPTRAFRLESVQLKTATAKNMTSNLRVYEERTFIKTNTAPSSGLSSLDDLSGKRFYENTYTFRIIDAASTSIVPIAQISSGTQIKHSIIDVNGTATINASSATIPATIAKALVSTNYAGFPTATIGGNSYIEVPYKITLSTTSSTAIKADKIVDVPAAGGIYKAGSTQISVGGATAVTYSDPETLTSESSLSPRPLHFFGPFTFSSTSNVVLTYKIYIPAVQGLYSNSATGFIGDRRIVSATTASIPAVKVTVGSGGTVTGSETTTVQLLPDPLTKPASSIDTSTATINGSINSNDTTTAGYFEWGTSSTLASKTTVSLGSITGNTATAKATSLTGLTTETTYYFRIVGIASGVRYEGAILSFTTLAQKAAPTVVTQAPTAVTLTNATLNATVDPNLTDVYVEFQVWSTTDTVTVRMTDDPSIDVDTNVNSNTYNPYSTYAGSSPSALSLKMSDFGLSGKISAGRTIYYRARTVAVTGGAITTATDTKQFKFAAYSDQTITFAAITDITWGDAAPVINPTSDSAMTVARTSLTPSVCTIDGSGNVVIVSAGICSLAANQPGGEKTAGVFYNPAEEVTQTFVINTRAITLEADNKSKFFGATDPALTFTRTVGTLAGSDTYTGTIERVAGTAVGTYQISQGNLSLGSNYVITFVNATFTINARPITISAAAKTKVYGTSDPVLTYTLSESLVAGEGTTGALTRAPGTAAGTYAINQGTLALSSNYSVTYNVETLTITAKPLVIRADSKTKASGGTEPAFTYSISGLVSPDSITSVSLSFPGPSATAPTADGSYDITPSAASFGTGSAANYSITYETGTYTITNKTPQALTWTTIANKTFGETATATATSNSGLIPSIVSLTTSICTVPNSSVSGATVTLLSIGTCQLRASQAGDATYAPATSVDTSFEVTAKALTITATVTNATRTYGDASATQGYTNSTLAGSDAISTVTLTFTSGAPVYNSTAVPTHAGAYTLTPSGLILSSGSASNYTITYATTSYTINKKALTITASSHSITEGDSVPNITASYATFAYTESAANLTGTQNCSTTYTISSAAGSYASTCSGYSSDDYTITYVAGTVTAASASGATTYTVTYNIGSGTGTAPTETPKTAGASFTTAASTGFSRDGYTFAGWSCGGVTYNTLAPITMGSSNLTCTALWSQNSSSSPEPEKKENSPATSNKPVKKVGISSMTTVATKPVTALVQVVDPAKPAPSASPAATPRPSATPSPAPSASPAATPRPSATPSPAPSASPAATPKPSATPSASPSAEPSPSATPGQEPAPMTESNNPLKQTSFTGKGIAKVNVRDEEITVVAKAGFSGNTVVKVTVANDEEISQITANVIVLPLPPANPVAMPVSEERTRITWNRSPNALSYEVSQAGELLCKTTSVFCMVPFVVPATPAVEIISIGRDKTVSAPIAAKVIERPAPAPKPVQEIPDIVLVINFDTNKFNIDATDRKLIQGFARDVVKYGYTEIDISGHTDSRGGVDNNVLSANRAKAARDYLLTLVPDLKITVGAFADAINVASNSTAAGMAANRRAEFRVVKS